MRACERLVGSGRFAPTEPAGLLARSYYELLENKKPVLGMSILLFSFIWVYNMEGSKSYHNIFNNLISKQEVKVL